MSMRADNLSVSIDAVYVGQVGPLAGDGAASGILKAPVSDPRWLDAGGVAGDAQANLIHHGGPQRALNHYPAEHYALWRQRYPGTDDMFVPGVLGENITTQGMTEENVGIGDIFTLGEAVIQIAQPRMPCAKIGARTGIAGLARAVAGLGLAGWLYRVLEPGHIRVGDTLARIEQAGHGITLADLWRAHSARRPDATQRHQMITLAAQPTLAPEWRKMLAKRAR